MKPFVVIFLAIGAVGLAVYGALVHYDNYFPFGRMWETPSVRPHEEPILIMEKDLAPFKGGEAFFKTGNGEGLTSPLDAKAPETLARGRKAYTAYCVFCHGARHDGMGTVGQSFHPLPADLKSKKVLEKSDGALFYLISFGSERAPALATTAPVNDRWAIIHYLRSLKTGPEVLSHAMRIDPNSAEK